MFIDAPPPAAALVESLRGVGYSTATALADIIDNSIAAGADNVRLDFRWHGERTFITVIDNGHGMDGDELTAAMRLGGRSPLEERAEGDLGRFGLGLKTASFSQCRKLTVASKRRSSSLKVRCWDLDHITDPKINDWQLMTEAVGETAEKLGPIENIDQGTLVIWEKLDRLLRGLPRNKKKAEASFFSVAEKVERHLAMVFHRFLEGTRPALRLFINGEGAHNRVRPWDPFLSDHAATESTPEETIKSPQGVVSLRGFVLPHRDMLDLQAYRRAGGSEGWTAHQGFYVYRGGRMLVSGSWLGLGDGRAWTKEVQFQLARLKLEFPNKLDSDWNIDIRKSRARPPAFLRERLRDLAESVRHNARRVYAHRGGYGPRKTQLEPKRIWQAIEKKDGVSYRIDRSHPAVEEVMKISGVNSEAIERLLSLVEMTVPVRRIWLDEAERADAPEPKGELPDEERLRPFIESMLRHLVEGCGYALSDARNELKKTEPFDLALGLVDKICDEYGGGKR